MKVQTQIINGCEFTIDYRMCINASDEPLLTLNGKETDSWAICDIRNSIRSYMSISLLIHNTLFTESDINDVYEFIIHSSKTAFTSNNNEEEKYNGPKES